MTVLREQWSTLEDRLNPESLRRMHMLDGPISLRNEIAVLGMLLRDANEAVDHVTTSIAEDARIVSVILRTRWQLQHC